LTLVIVTHAIEEAIALGSKILLLDSSPRVFENPQVGQENHRNSREYRELCDLLWKEMRNEK
jgi:ABC-type nitrate/sulfonate/bicarbonate transport system ATPase subunit